MINNQPVHWFDGYDTTTVSFSGSNVTAWQDKSGNGRNAVTAGTMNITYDGAERGLKFNGAPGVPGYLAIRNSASLFKNTPFTIFVVEKKNSSLNNNLFYAMDGSMYTSSASSTNKILNLGYVVDNTIRFDPWNTALDSASSTYTSFTRRLWTFRLPSTGSRTTRLNGTDVASTTNINQLTGDAPFNIGFLNAFGIQTFYNGTIYEIVAYHGDLTDSQVQQMEGYLAWKWDLKSSLPSTHPYKITNPNAPIISARPALWHDGFDQTTLTYSGANVTGWADKSGNNRNSTTATSVITYDSTGRGLVFNGTAGASGMLATANSAALFKNTPYTLFLVEKKNFAGALGVLGSDAGAATPTTDTALNVYYSSDTNMVVGQWGTAVQYGNAQLSGSTIRIWAATNPTSGSRTLRLNGSIVGTDTSISKMSGTYPLLVGGYRYTNTYYAYNGTIYEIIGYHGDLTTAQIQQNEGYLAWKWGLQASLPSTHPYFSVNSNVFNPVILFRPVHWFDAYFSTNMTFSSGSNISAWLDRSSNALNATKQGGSAIVGYDSADRGVYFADGTNGYLLSSNSSNLYKNTPFTIFAVEKKSGETTRYFYNNVSTFQTNTTLVLGYNGSNSRFVQYGNDINYFNTVNTGSVKRLTTYQTPEGPLSSFMRQNGALVGTRPNNTLMVGDGGNIAVGFHFPGDAYIGTIYEIVGFHDSLSPQQIQLIEGSLAWKWGLQGDLPAGHTYKNVNPNTLTPSIVVRPDAENSSISYFWSLSNAPVAVSSYNLVITDNASFSNTVPLGSSSGVYTVNGLTNGVPYSGFITANNELRSAGPTATFRTVEPGGLASAPQSVQITPVGSNKVLLSWQPAASNGGASVKWHTIKNSTATVRLSARGYQTALLTPMISTGRQQFSVQAVNDVGYGDFRWSPIFSIPFGSFIPNIYLPFDGSLDEFYLNATTTAFGSALQYSTNTVIGSQSLRLNGTDQYLNVNYPDMNWSQLTFSGWVHPFSSAQWMRIFDFGVDVATNMACTPISGNNTLLFSYGKTGQTTQVIEGVPLQTNVWSHVAVTTNGSAGYLYRNGILVGSNMSMTLRPLDVMGNNKLIGESAFVGNPNLNAMIDEFAFISTALDASTIALIHDSGTLLGSNVLSLSTVSTIVTSGLTFWVDPLSKTSYGGGATLYNQGPLNVNGTLGGSYALSNGEGIRLSNTPQLNVSRLDVLAGLSNLQTISLWYKTLSLGTFTYVIDLRSNATSAGNAWIYLNPVNIGSGFANSIVYSDGDNMRRIENCSNAFSSEGNWRNLTIVAPTKFTDDVNFFSRFTCNAALDCVFGPIQVYDRVLTRDENIQNYNRYRSRYGLASVVQNGLIYRTDPVDLLSWSTGMTRLNNMMSNGINGTLNGSYGAPSPELGLRLSNTSTDSLVNATNIKASGNLSTVQTISLWYNLNSLPSEAYVFDARIGGTFLLILQNKTLNIGGLSNATIYVNGDETGMTPVQATSSITSLQSWKNITITTPSGFTDDITFYGYYDANFSGMDATIGPTLVYNRALTAAENTENFNRFKYRYGLYVVPNGLVYWADPLNSACYTSGTVLGNLATGNNVSGTLNGAYSKIAYEGIRLTNTSTYLNNSAALRTSSLTMRTFSVWYKVLSSPTTWRYIVDARTGNTNGYILYSITNQAEIGSFWSTATVYYNGGAAQSLNAPLVATMFTTLNSWQNYTLISASNAVTDDVNFFSAADNLQGMDVTFGPIMVYDRVISQAENLQNFNTYRVRYGL